MNEKLTIKQLRERSLQIFLELNPLMLRHFKFSRGKPLALLSPSYRKRKKRLKLKRAEHNRMLSLAADYAEINGQIEEKRRKRS